MALVLPNMISAKRGFARRISSCRVCLFRLSAVPPCCPHSRTPMHFASPPTVVLFIPQTPQAGTTAVYKEQGMMMTETITAAMLFVSVSTAYAFVRPIGTVALPRAPWSKVNSASQMHARTSGTKQQMALESEEEKRMHAFGASHATRTDRVKRLLSTVEKNIVLQGFTDHWLEAEKMQLDLGQYVQQVNIILGARKDVFERTMAVNGVNFLEEAAQAVGGVRTESGMVIQTIKEGTGAHPLPTDTVTAHFRSSLIDGTVLDSSAGPGLLPIRFPLKVVMWAEGIQRMKVGGKSKIIIPPQLAFGEEGTSDVPPNATMVFEVELLETEHWQWE